MTKVMSQLTDSVENNCFPHPLPLFGLEQLAHWLSVTFTNSEDVM